MRRQLTLVPLAAVAVLVGVSMPPPASAGTVTAGRLCVGGAARCYSGIQAAVDAAADGAVIQVAPGTYPGGISLRRDVTIVGAGAGRTIIRGGGPVISIGEPDSSNPPVVAISRVTISGGVNRTVPDPTFAVGGGVLVYWGAGGAPGATVRLEDSVVSGNSVNPATTGDCGFPCSFAKGGGIFNAGHLTLLRTVVAGNSAGISASHSWGGGVWNDPNGSLTVRESSVSSNRSAVSTPNGHLAEAGGIFNLGRFDMSDSTVASNSAELVGSSTLDDERLSNSGGLTLHGTSIVRDSLIRDNKVLDVNTLAGGFTNAFGGGLTAKGDLLMTGTRVMGNSVTVISGGDAIAEGGGIADVDATTTTIRDSVVSGNTTWARGTHGNQSTGGGVMTGGAVAITDTEFSRNVVRADGGAGPMPWGDPSVARGGGVANIAGDPNPALSLRDSSVRDNSVTASAGIPTSGGGLISTAALNLRHTVFSGNAPDECLGCS
jgi:hypothetical protein